MIKPLTILLFITLAAWTLPHSAMGATIVVNGNTADNNARDLSTRDGVGDTVGDVTDTTIRVGLAGTTGSVRGQSVVLVFELPTIAVGETINFASGNLNNLFFNVASVTGTSGQLATLGNTDLYGLGFRSASTVLAGDYFNGASDATDATLLQDNILASSPATGGTDTNASGDIALGTYVQAQYTAGAVGGDFVFLRLSFDGTGSTTNPAGTNITSANSGTTAARPTLTLDVIPEPSTFGMLIVGIAGLLGMRRLKRRSFGDANLAA